MYFLAYVHTHNRLERRVRGGVMGSVHLTVTVSGILASVGPVFPYKYRAASEIATAFSSHR